MISQMFSSRPLTLAEGLKIQASQVQFFVEKIREQFGEEKVTVFTDAVQTLNETALTAWADGRSIPRGIHLEQIYMMKIKGMTREEYTQYLRSMD
jgi:hypothetical protein